MRQYTHHFARSVVIAETAEQVFDQLDDPRRVGLHMARGSAMMLGGSMRYHLDADAGRSVGSVIRIEGRMMGLSILVSERITERNPPARKVWETFGARRLIVMKDYRMGYETGPVDGATRLRVFIDYSLPSGFPGRWIGAVFAPVYARWCVSRIADGAMRSLAR